MDEYDQYKRHIIYSQIENNFSFHLTLIRGIEFIQNCFLCFFSIATIVSVQCKNREIIYIEKKNVHIWKNYMTILDIFSLIRHLVTCEGYQ